MTPLESSTAFFVGSIPFDSVDEVFDICGTALGDRLFAIPDGEVGWRREWVAKLRWSYHAHPDLELVIRADIPDPPPWADYNCQFRVRPGTPEFVIDTLPYADAALSSYRIFCRKRDEGVIPKHVRFQVDLATPHAGVEPFFPNHADWPSARRAYVRGIRLEVAKILEVIPHDDLAIQWDFCSELMDAAGLGWLNEPGRSAAEKVRQHTGPEYLGPLTKDIPAGVIMGFHLCYGTFGGWPMTTTANLSTIVEMANGIVANSQRSVDYLHLPAVRDPGPEFFAPLRDLQIGDTKVILGLECGDGVDAMVRRIALAREARPDFAISHFCGYGRESAATITQLVEDLRSGAERLEQLRQGVSSR